MNITFAEWMNRPLSRVHVVTWRIACVIEPSQPAAGLGGPLLRGWSPTRTPHCRAWRKATADVIRRARRAGRIKLPRYVESSACFVWEADGWSQVARAIGPIEIAPGVVEYPDGRLENKLAKRQEWAAAESLGRCCAEFQAEITALAEHAQLAPVAVYALWREYSDACSNSDQSALIGEFKQWYAPQLGLATQSNPC